MLDLGSVRQLSAVGAVCTLVLGAIVCTNSKAQTSRGLQAQRAERLIKMTSIRNAPISLVNAQVADTDLRGREKVTASARIAEWKEWRFEEGNGWLNRLRFTFKNVSDKPLIAITVELLVSHPGLPAPLSVPLSPNRHIPAFLNPGMEAAAKAEKMETLLPNEEVTYSLSPASINLIAVQLNRLGALGPINEVELNLGRIQFDYDTSWDEGLIFRRDRASPDQWRPEKSEAHAKKKGSIVKASYSSGKGNRFSLQGACRSSVNDLYYDCWGLGFYCKLQDQTLSNDSGSYTLVEVIATCYDFENQPCNTNIEYADRRRVNRNCVV